MKEKVIILKEDGTEDKAAMFRQKLKSVMDSVKTKVKEVWPKVKESAAKMWSWFKDNKEDVGLFLATALGAIGFCKKTFAKPHVESERERINTTYYDPVTGCHWRLRRPLTNDERSELVRRRRMGEYSEDILEDMRVLR